MRGIMFETGKVDFFCNGIFKENTIQVRAGEAAVANKKVSDTVGRIQVRGK